jgi:P2-related tail formation protein
MAKHAPHMELRLPALRNLCPELALQSALLAWNDAYEYSRKRRTARAGRMEVRASRRYHALRRILGA